MVPTSAIPLQERESFHLFLLKHLNVHLKNELFLLQWYSFIFFLNLLKSTISFLKSVHFILAQSGTSTEFRPLSF